MRTILITWLLTISVLLVAQQDGLGRLQIENNDGEKELLLLSRTSSQFAVGIPHEKVYLHFDNTSYFQYDNIWFKCYLVTSGHNKTSLLSKTLYVELLNPGGEIVEKKILKVENEQCHGAFTLNHLPFYSGFYEIRAYTKYMLNFGEDVIFSRLLPVFNKPKKEGNWEEKKMLSFNKNGPAGSFPMKRPKSEKDNKVNVRFFPEGGNLIQGVTSRVAFEATDEIGNPIDVTGIVTDALKQERGRLATTHEGRGVFSYLPVEGKEKAAAEVEYEGKKYRFDLPGSQPTGIVMEIDNLTYPDIVGITLRRNNQTPPELVGINIVSGANPQNAYIYFTADEETYIEIDKTSFSPGVSQIVLFNKHGDILSDRLLFTFPNEQLDIKASAQKPSYNPRELVEMDFQVNDNQANPVSTTFSLSVRDGANEVDSRNNILTDLLLMSDIKGYVRNPTAYFKQKNDSLAASQLDLLLMVQGWRRYVWKQMAGAQPFEVKYIPEQGIETLGTVVNFVRKQPKANIDVSLLLSKKEEASIEGKKGVELFKTDEEGRFSFVLDVQGRWDMILSVMEKNKKKDHLIILDRVFTPNPGKYRFVDMQVNVFEENDDFSIIEETARNEADNDYETFLAATQDSLAKLGIDQKIINLPEVTVKAKRSMKEKDIFRSRSTAIAYYDVHTEIDDIYDRGDVLNDNIHDLLRELSAGFVRYNSDSGEYVIYKNKKALFVVNHEKTDLDIYGYLKYSLLRLTAIKSIYINEQTAIIAQYIIPPMGSIESPYELAQQYGCVVLIETYPPGQIPTKGAKGVRKTRLDGYSAVKEFYKPNFLDTSPEPDPDYRRTLYWNPLVTTDETGAAKIQFFNNNSCRTFSINAETITPQGIIGVLSR